MDCKPILSPRLDESASHLREKDPHPFEPLGTPDLGTDSLRISAYAINMPCPPPHRATTNQTQWIFDLLGSSHSGFILIKFAVEHFSAFRADTVWLNSALEWFVMYDSTWLH